MNIKRKIKIVESFCGCELKYNSNTDKYFIFKIKDDDKYMNSYKMINYDGYMYQYKDYLIKRLNSDSLNQQYLKNIELEALFKKHFISNFSKEIKDFKFTIDLDYIILKLRDLKIKELKNDILS